ncbi:pancreatic triacylglycerol lipase-like [Aplysia californica]|uniref:Pancreatic triacylglycerol lipase-like n=1 Tax=Aplysia californica TaxID=6500 RepID=A0ABM1A3Z9_APLCA|nr:pancreatic triacylglycerol lipase-like [Aplysia californica]
MSRLIIVLTVSFCLLGLALSLDNFLDCPGNDNILGWLRRCCPSEDLPNSCECFDISNSSPFTNSAFHKPQCPQDINVIFRLYNPSASSGNIIKAGAASVRNSPFNPSLPTRVVAHGFTDSGEAPWMLEMKDEFLKQVSQSVL